MKFTLLCIDDDARAVDALRAAAPPDVLVESCCDLEEGFERVVVEQPDLLVLEPRLRGGNALDLLERVRCATGEASLTPAIVVTRAGRMPGIHGRAMQLGVAAYFGKPAGAAELGRAIREALEKRADPLAVTGPETAVGIGSGRLVDLPFAELLDRVHRRAESGVLVVGDARRRTGIQIRNGSPVAITPAEAEGIDEFLVRHGRLSAAAREAAIAQAPLGFGTIEDVLVDAGLVDDDALDGALAEQADEALFSLFELPKGRYRFEPGRRLKGTRSLDLSRSAQCVIVRGILAHAPIEKVRESLERYGRLYVASNPDPDPTPDDVPCSEAQRRFLDGLAGERTVAEFVDGSEFELRTLYAFAILGGVALSDEPMLVLDDALAASDIGAEPEEEEILDLEDAIEDAPSEEAPAPPIVAADAEADLSYEDSLFEDDSGGTWQAAPAEALAGQGDFSYEDDLFEERAFEEDSFEQAMVSEEASGEQSRLDIDEMLSDAVADPKPDADRATPESPAEEPDPEPELEASAPVRDADEQASSEDVLDLDPVLPFEAEVAAAIAEEAAAAEEPAAPAPPAVEEAEEAEAEEERAEAEEETSQAGRYSVDARANAHAREEVPAPVAERRAPAPPPARIEEPAPTEPEDELPSEAARPVPPAQPEPSAPEKVAAAPKPKAKPEPEPEPARPDSSKSYEIAPMGTVQTDPAERALIAARVQKRLDRRYAQLLERKKPPTEAVAAEDSAASRALEAESWFRKGTELMKLKRYDEAVEAFGMSAHQDPNEGEYVAHLGYALYLSNPDDETVRKEALEDIARGVKLSPDRELSYVYLGRIFKVQGDLDNARKLFERALKIRPKCRQAAQEIRLMDMRDQKKASGGLLGRFLKS